MMSINVTDCPILNLKIYIYIYIRCVNRVASLAMHSFNMLQIGHNREYYSQTTALVFFNSKSNMSLVS